VTRQQAVSHSWHDALSLRHHSPLRKGTAAQLPHGRASSSQLASAAAGGRRPCPVMRRSHRSHNHSDSSSPSHRARKGRQRGLRELSRPDKYYCALTRSGCGDASAAQGGLTIRPPQPIGAWWPWPSWGCWLIPAASQHIRGQTESDHSQHHPPTAAPQPSTTHRQRTGRVCEQHRRMWRRHGCRAWAVRAAQHSGRGSRRISPHGSHIRSVSDVSQSLMISTNRGASPVREMNALLLCVRHRHQEARRREGVEHTMRCGRQRLRPRSQRR
jgi:hypothetical protein